jgi:hypothetical protein
MGLGWVILQTVRAFNLKLRYWTAEPTFQIVSGSRRLDIPYLRHRRVEAGEEFLVHTLMYPSFPPVTN